MISKVRNNSASNIQQTQKVISETVSTLKGSKASNEEIIRKIASEKRTQIKPPKQKAQQKIPIQTQSIQDPLKQQITEFEKKDNEQTKLILIEHTREIEDLNNNFQQSERNYQMKIKDKIREINQIKERIIIQEASIEDLNQQLKTLKDLLEQKVGSEQVNYFERRNLVMSQTILNQRRLINQYTKSMQQTKMIQVELDFQLEKISQHLTSQTLDKQLDNFYNEILKMKQKLNYITSQEKYNKSDDYFKKSKVKKDNLDISTRIENCLALVVQHLSQNDEILFSKTKLHDTLTTLSIQILQAQDKMPLNIQMINVQTMLDNHLVRVQGKFTSLFPQYNSTKELIINNIQNDKIFQLLGAQEMHLEELKCVNQKSISLPAAAGLFLFKSISILRSILIHTLACIHTFNLQPQLKSLSTKIIPFNEDCLTIFDQYHIENPSMGAQILWGVFKTKAESLSSDIQQTKQEYSNMKSQYKGLWSQLLHQDYFQ